MLNHRRKKENYIISVSTGFDNRKNIRNGLYAFAKIRERYPELSYKIVGGNMHEGGKAHQFAIDNDLIKGVEFMGFQKHDQTMDLIKRSRLFLHPSREESFGNVVLESMLLRTLFIGGKQSGNIPFLVNDGQTGFLTNVDSPEDIASTIAKAMDLEVNERTRILEDAYDFAKTNFSVKSIVDKLVEYLELVYTQSSNGIRK